MASDLKTLVKAADIMQASMSDRAWLRYGNLLGIQESIKLSKKKR
jgi:hypothetical protein